MSGAGHTVNMPGAYDALTARRTEQPGFAVAFVSGYAVSAARLAAPDFGYLTQNEMADAAHEACTATEMPIVVDANTDCGNARSAIRTARGLAAVGASGIFLEDQVWPKECGHFAGKCVVEVHEWLTRLRAIVDLRSDGVDLFVVARTDARAAASLGEANARAQAAMEVDVGAIVVETPTSIEALGAVAEAAPGTVRVANMVDDGRTPLLTPTELRELGCDLIVTPLTALFAATHAIQEAFATLSRDGTMRGHRDAMIDFADFAAVVDLTCHQELERRHATEPVVDPS